MKIEMKSLMTFLIAFVLVLGAFSQEETQQLSPKEIKKLQKEQKNAARAAEEERMAEVTRYMVHQQQFALEADYLSDKYGQRVTVTPTINFVMIDSLVGTVQFGDALAVGYNGVGGVTVDGRITKYEYSVIGKKEDSYSIRLILMSSIGTYDITLMVNSQGYADAQIRGNWSGQLNYHGKLVPLTLSRVYKGTPIL
jgi:Na+-transporting methylmalonyl-CoA/oxaloacetate decarboxylase gamma subunit